MQDGDTPSHCTSDPLLAKSGALCTHLRALLMNQLLPYLDSQINTDDEINCTRSNLPAEGNDADTCLLL